MKKEAVQIFVKGNVPLMALGSILLFLCCILVYAALKAALFFNYLLMAMTAKGIKKMWKGEIEHGKGNSIRIKKGDSWEVFIDNLPSARQK